MLAKANYAGKRKDWSSFPATIAVFLMEAQNGNAFVYAILAHIDDPRVL